MGRELEPVTSLELSTTERGYLHRNKAIVPIARPSPVVMRRR
jgi:hypothetical protein